MGDGCAPGCRKGSRDGFPHKQIRTIYQSGGKRKQFEIDCVTTRPVNGFFAWGKKESQLEYTHVGRGVMSDNFKGAYLPARQHRRTRPDPPGGHREKCEVLRPSYCRRLPGKGIGCPCGSPEAERQVASIRAKGARLAIPGVVDLSDFAAKAKRAAKIVLESVQHLLLKLALQMARDNYGEHVHRHE